MKIYKKRIYEIFNYDGHGYIDWNNFYSMISVCYFASEDILAVIIFMIFDDSLSKELTKIQLTALCYSFDKYIHMQEEE